MSEREERTVDYSEEALASERRARREAEARCEELEAELRAARQATAEAEDARQAFVSLVTHELRVPMTSIRGYTDLLLKGIMGPVNDAQGTFLKTIRSNVARMSHMVADLAEINKLEGDRLTFNIEDVPLAESIQEAVADYAEQFEKKSQTLGVELPEELPAVRCDRSRLVEVLKKLLDNAYNYTPERGAIIIRAEEKQDGETRKVHLVVEDTGIGIVPQEQDQIFEKFFRASDEETRQVTGNGLSLHLSKLLVEQQGGQIWFESERGTGTAFHLTLPASQD